MEVILIERVAKLGQIGEVVRVRSGFARNFLLPQGKALRATKENRERFESIRAELEAKNADKKTGADVVAKSLDGQSFILIRQAGETGHLYGSVSARDIMQALSAKEFEVSRQQIVLNMPIKMIGMYKVPVTLHPEVEVTVSLTVARSADEAERLKRGENVTIARDEADEAAAAAAAAAEAFFEPEAIEALRSQEGEPTEQSEADAKPAG